MARESSPARPRAPRSASAPELLVPALQDAAADGADADLTARARAAPIRVRMLAALEQLQLRLAQALELDLEPVDVGAQLRAAGQPFFLRHVAILRSHVGTQHTGEPR